MHIHIYIYPKHSTYAIFAYIRVVRGVNGAASIPVHRSCLVLSTGSVRHTAQRTQELGQTGIHKHPQAIALAIAIQLYEELQP